MNLTYINQVLNKILCDIKDLQVIKKLRILSEGIIIEEDTKSINFTGNVEVSTDISGNTTVNIPPNDFDANRVITRDVIGLLGENLGTQGVIDTLEQLLYPYLAPSIVLSAPSNSVFEKTTGSTNITITGTSTKNSLNITEFLFLLNDIEISDVAPVDIGGETASYIHSTPNTDNTSTTPILQTFSTSVSDGTTTIESNTRIRTLVYPYYRGVGTAALNEAGIKGLTKLVQTSGDKTATFSPSNQKIYFAYPSTYGALTQIDDGAFNVTSAFSLTTPTFTMLDGQSVQYNVYESNNLLTVSGYILNFIL